MRVILLPFWIAWPALAHPVDDGLPRLRPAIARNLPGADRAPWPVVFLAFAAEAARSGRSGCTAGGAPSRRDSGDEPPSAIPKTTGDCCDACGDSCER